MNVTISPLSPTNVAMEIQVDVPVTQLSALVNTAVPLLDQVNMWKFTLPLYLRIDGNVLLLVVFGNRWYRKGCGEAFKGRRGGVDQVSGRHPQSPAIARYTPEHVSLEYFAYDL